MFESLESRTHLSISPVSNGAVTINGTGGNDTIVVAKKSKTLIEVTGASKKATDLPAGLRLFINGGDGDDKITINPDAGYKSAVIHGNKGNDTIRGGAKIDEIDGDAGKDYLYGGDSADRINGGDDNDTAEIDVGEVRIVQQHVVIHGRPVTQNIPVPFNKDDAYDMGKGNDTIKIQGTNQKDRIFLERTTVKVGTKDVKVLELDGAGKSTISITNNEIIEVNALNGNDRIRITGTAHLFGHINLNGGNGFDTFVGVLDDLDGTKTPVNIEPVIQPPHD